MQETQSWVVLAPSIYPGLCSLCTLASRASSLDVPACVHVCVHGHTCVYTHMGACARVHVCTHVHVRVRTGVHVHACTHGCMCTHVSVFMCAYVHLGTCVLYMFVHTVYVHTCAHMFTCVCVYACMHVPEKGSALHWSGVRGPFWGLQCGSSMHWHEE